MGTQVAITHINHYKYSRSIKVWPQIVRLRPAPHARTKITAYSLKISPKEHFINWMQDPFGNYQARIAFPDLTDEFKIQVELIADLVAFNPFDFFLDEAAEKFPFEYDEQLQRDLQPYLKIDESGPELDRLVETCRSFMGSNTVDFLVEVNRKVFEAISYTIRMEAGVLSCEQSLSQKKGSCRDSAWVLVQLFRHFNLAARFVSGYLIQLKPDQPSKKGPTGATEDFTDLHAWAEVFIPGAGWIGLDATSGLLAGEGHIPLACTPHHTSAAPVTGLIEKVESTFHFSNQVERIDEHARPSKPYTIDQWQQIVALGHKVDAGLVHHDVRLTMGGEPTFISETDMESSQWNTKADGKEKRTLALALSHQLKEEFGKLGIIHFGQGKWYPGEPIPRWQYSLYWRKDGQPLWTQQKYLADPTQRGLAKAQDLTRLMTDLAKVLKVDPSCILPAYEDRYYYLWQEHNLPHDFVSSDDTNIERKTLLELLKNDITEPVGMVLPLRWNIAREHWESCRWSFERDHLFLIPGNSQIGLRLPLDRLAKVSEDVVIPSDHFDRSDTLLEQNEIGDLLKTDDSEMHVVESNFKTSLCAQIRDGNICIFLPPLDHFNEFVILLAALESSCNRLNLQIVLEGYQPPYHPSVEKLVVAPDPGVIEVNVHPAHNWSELLAIYEVLFHHAAEVGLGTNKFMLDGKHTGTGGGNHITLGGKSPADSPLLRRPDLLRSMLSFWQNHPGLSYLFSSTFIGPTSQAPRVDEGRPENIYELEIAFAELENHANPPFYLVDRLFRNLLTDLMGNTHRAEFCIDKLYSPDSMSGRLGILELRAFDMPPHKEMCLVQLLLIRALVLSFWQEPYRQKLINWGTDLHNRFMLPYYVEEDMKEVVQYLRDRGVAFDISWLEAFLSFRFPEIGSVTINGIKLSLHSALEPWIVLGEEMATTGTARYVDSSVERLQVMVEDFNPNRYAILCNNIEVPLSETKFKGKFVAGVRYKAWAPPSALHPTIGVNSPLVFDIYDRWNERSLGGCTYHVMHPGGRNYETYPVNSLEAESRRVSRFQDFNHSPKADVKIASQQDGNATVSFTEHHIVKESLVPRKIAPSGAYPHTLDLRKS